MITHLGTHRRVDAALPVAPDLELSGYDLLGYSPGDRVTLWPDASGNGHDLPENAFGNAQYLSDSVGPGVSMDFDGYGEARIPALESASITIFAVCYPGGGAITPGGSILSMVGDTYTGWTLRSTNTGALQLFGYENGTYKPNPAATPAHTSPILVAAWWEPDSQGIRVDGVAEWTDTRTYGLGGYGLATDLEAGDGWKGNLYHVLLYTSRLTPAEIADTEAYLQTLWSII